MVNQRAQSLFLYAAASASAASSSRGTANAPPPNSPYPTIDQLINLIREDPECRGQAISALSKIRDGRSYLASAIWHSPLIVTILVQEVLGAYKFLSPSKLNSKDIERVRDTLTLFMFVASHKETRKLFMDAQIPVYLYPFLKPMATVTGQQTDFLQLASLGVIASLTQDDDPEAVKFLLETDVFPLCLHCLEHRDERLNIIAAHVISKMFAQNVSYICDNLDRFQALVVVMRSVLDRIEQTSSQHRMLLLLRAMINCYFYLSTYQRFAAMLKHFFPAKLRSDPILDMLRACDSECFKLLEVALCNIINAQGV